MNVMTALSGFPDDIDFKSRSFIRPKNNAAFRKFLNQSVHLGFDPSFVNMLMDSSPEQASSDDYWMAFIHHYLDITDLNDSFETGHRHLAVAGDVASGKSTLLAQLACKISKKSTENDIALILCENSSGLVNELLVGLSRIMNCPLLYLRSPQELNIELQGLGRHRRLLIDLPSKPTEQLAYLEYFRNVQSTSQLGVLCVLARRAEILSHKSTMQLWLKYGHAWAMSFAAEHSPIGSAISAASKSPRPLAYFSKSDDLMEGLEVATVHGFKALMMSAITRLHHGQTMNILAS